MSLATLFRNAVKADDLVRNADHARDCKDWAGAAKAYAAAISSGNVSAGLKVQLGHALKEMGDYDGAERLYREFLRDHSRNTDIHLQLGHLFNKKGDPETARAFYEKALELAPDDAEILRHATRARRDIGRRDVVRRRVDAMALVAARKWGDARPLLYSLVAIDGEDDLIGILANVTKETGQLDEAEIHYASYLQYAEKCGSGELMEDCHTQLGHLNKIKGAYSIALTHFLRARKVRRMDGETDAEKSELDREIVACLRDIYPCFVFHD